MLMVKYCDGCKTNSNYVYGLIEFYGFDTCEKCHNIKHLENKLSFCSKKCLLKFLNKKK